MTLIIRMSSEIICMFGLLDQIVGETVSTIKQYASGEES